MANPEPGLHTVTFAAGVVDPVGALGIVLALVNGGRPNVVPLLDFGGAPVVSVFVAMVYSQPQESPSPLFRPRDTSELIVRITVTDAGQDRTSSTICCRNAAGYGGLDFGIVAPPPPRG